MTYFDNAATTLKKPPSVLMAIGNCAKNYGANPGRSGHKLSMLAAKKVYECRENAAGLFDAEPENVAFTKNCTEALNVAIKGILKPGDHVIMSDLEHNSVFRPIYHLSQSGGVSYSIATVFDGDFAATVRAFESCINEKTKLIACTAGSNMCGIMLPCEELYTLCRRYNISLLLDLAQTAGVRKTSLKKADYLCMPGHKGLYGPMGTGMLITNKGEQLDTIMEGGTGSQSFLAQQPPIMPDRLESGTINTYGIAGLDAGITFVKNTGLDKIYSHEMKLCSMLYAGLSKINGIKLYTQSPKQGYHLPVLCFNVKDYNSEAMVEELSNRGFALRGGYHCAPLAHSKFKTGEIGAVRASFSVFNTEDEVARLLSEIKKL